MEKYKGTVASCEPVPDRQTGEIKPDPQYGNYGFTVIFTDGFKGRAFSKSNPHPYFVPEKEVEFTGEKKASGWILKAPQDNKGTYKGTRKEWHTKKPDEIKREYVGFAAGYTKDLVIAGKIEMGEFAETLAIIQGAINKEVDNIT
jgi:hypothetical protein